MTLLSNIKLVSFHLDFISGSQTQEQQRSTEQRQITLKTTPAADRGRYARQNHCFFALQCNTNA